MSIDKVINDLTGYDDAHMHFESKLRALNRIADGVTEGVIVAIGSFRGQMDAAIALHAHVPVYCIDPRLPWDGEPRQFGDGDRAYWYANIAALGLVERVRPIELPSLEVAKIWDKPIGLLFVDGNHLEVDADLDAWFPHVMDGGLVAVHDNNLPSVIAAVTRRADIVEIERAALVTVYRKESLYEQYTYDDLTLSVRKGPYNKDDKYVLGEVRSYDIGTEPIRTLIDVGAHIGSFSAWIKQLWPDCQIVAVEPEASGYLVAYQNLEPLSALVLNSRVNYDGDDKLLFVDPVNSGSHRILDGVPNGAPAVPAPAAITLEQIMRKMGWDTLDLLKIDCEGAERDILLNCTDDFLRSVRRIVGEFHTNFGSPMEPLMARLEALGFAVTSETNPAAHATFVGINQNWQEPDEERRYIGSYNAADGPVKVFAENGQMNIEREELPFEYGVPVEEAPKTVTPTRKKAAAKGRKR